MPDNRKPLKYGAFPVCRNYTVRAHLRHYGTGTRHGCEDPVHDHWTRFLGNHPGHLLPRDRHHAEAGGGENRPPDRQNRCPDASGGEKAAHRPEWLPALPAQAPKARNRLFVPDQRPPLGGKILSQRSRWQTHFPERLCQNQRGMRRKTCRYDRGSKEGD